MSEDISLRKLFINQVTSLLISIDTLTVEQCNTIKKDIADQLSKQKECQSVNTSVTYEISVKVKDVETKISSIQLAFEDQLDSIQQLARSNDIVMNIACNISTSYKPPSSPSDNEIQIPITLKVQIRFT